MWPLRPETLVSPPPPPGGEAYVPLHSENSEGTVLDAARATQERLGVALELPLLTPFSLHRSLYCQLHWHHSAGSKTLKNIYREHLPSFQLYWHRCSRACLVELAVCSPARGLSIIKPCTRFAEPRWLV